jgi:hypothetical protein|tara:strand:- start:601 stop:837 length:237 start_codon:yes stop_codon:yes gene_type:complete
MKQKVKAIVTNWRFNPPFDGYDGQVISENYEVGIDGVEDIIENEPKNGLQKWNYVVRKSDGTAIRLFNVNEAIYYANS